MDLRPSKTPEECAVRGHRFKDILLTFERLEVNELLASINRRDEAEFEKSENVDAHFPGSASRKRSRRMH
jgi:hypothetical protein